MLLVVNCVIVGAATVDPKLLIRLTLVNWVSRPSPAFPFSKVLAFTPCRLSAPVVTLFIRTLIPSARLLLAVPNPAT